MRRLRACARELKRSADGRRQFGLGARVGYWPCLLAPYVQVTFLWWRLEAWFGLPARPTA